MSVNPLSHEEISDHQTLLDEIPYAVLVIDTDSIIYCNNVTLELFNTQNADDIIDRSITTFFPEKQSDGIVSKDQFLMYQSRANAGEKVLFDWVYQTLQSDLIFCKVTLHTIQYKGKTCLLEPRQLVKNG